MKIGDKIQFQIGEEIFQDIITYIDNGKVEGEKFDLTMIIINGKFILVK
jgi:hypothetical protein